MKKYQNKQWLDTMYNSRGLDSVAMAAICNVDPRTIYTWMQKNGLLRRSASVARHQAMGNHVCLSETALAYLEGELLGDGGVYTRGKYSALYRHGSKHREYLEWLSGILSSLGIKQSGHINRNQGRYGTIWLYTTKSYTELLPLRQRWYPDGHKHIPGDLILTPVRVRQWFIGDGSFSHHSGGQYIKFATYGFARAEVVAIAHKLAVALGVNIGDIHVHKTVSGPRICFGKKDVVRAFYDYIGPCPPAIEGIYGYKWEGA